MAVVVVGRRRKRRKMNVSRVFWGVNVDQPEENDDNK
jgi:hypothetical protein